MKIGALQNQKFIKVLRTCALACQRS